MASGRTAATIFAILGTVTGVIAGRESIVSAVPPTAALYAAIGLRVNLDRIEIGPVTATVRFEQDLRTLVVETEISNLRGPAIAVPPLRLSIRNAGGETVYTWTSQVAGKTLAAGGRMPVRARLTAPPAGDDVVVEFIRAAT